MRETFALTDLFDCMISLERTSRELYLGLAVQHMQMPRLHQAFTELAGWERRHEELFMRLKLSLTLAADDLALRDDPEQRDYLQALVESVLNQAAASRHACHQYRQALEMALSLEKETVLFLSGIIPHLAHSGAPAVEAVLREEKRHIIIIQKLLRDEAANATPPAPIAG